jgi:quercetin dioxygenase-like cupin family protein
MSGPLKIWRTEDYREMPNPSPGEWFRNPILAEEDRAKEMGGLVVILPPGQAVPYHYHKNRESLLLVLGGEAFELYEDKEYPIRAGDVLFIPAGAKHAVINRSGGEVRFLEFFTHPPMGSDFIKVE